MFQALAALARDATVERVTLLVNHVLASEPAAGARLQRHAGGLIRLVLRNWPSLLPAVAPLAFRITPAGLLEWCGPGEAPAEDAAGVPFLEVAVDAANPALLMLRQLAGERPRIEVGGDAGLAADVSWLADNLRWDIEDDLERIVGPRAAHELARAGRWLARALRGSLDTAGRAMDRLRPATGGVSGAHHSSR